MCIADREQRAHRVYGHEQRGAGHQVLVVDVAGMNARRAGADTPHSRRGSHPHHAEKRTVDRYYHSGSDPRGLGLAIDRDDTLEHTRKCVRQRARVRSLTVVTIVDREIDPQDANLQCVAGLRAINEDRPGKDMSRRAAILDLAMNGTLVFWHDARRHGAGSIDLYRVE